MQKPEPPSWQSIGYFIFRLSHNGLSICSSLTYSCYCAMLRNILEDPDRTSFFENDISCKHLVCMGVKHLYQVYRRGWSVQGCHWRLFSYFISITVFKKNNFVHFYISPAHVVKLYVKYFLFRENGASKI